MPVPLDEMMKTLGPEARAEVERAASALVAEHRGRTAPVGAEPADATGARDGLRAATGQRCPESGLWRVEDVPSATVPIALYNLMPPYHDRAVTWVLVRRAA